MFSKFFIDRPIFATVVSILFVLGGLISLFGLPVEQYPEITPPTVVVRASYPGASAQTIADMVASPIEQEVNGVEGMLYMSSTSSSTGDYSLTVTFDLGTNLDMANIFVENRVNAVLRTLPEEVQELGVTTSKESSNVVVFITLTSDNPIYDALFLSNYAALNIENNLARLEGVGNVSLFGAGDYSMRIWLDPDQLAIRGVTPEDIIEAIEAQNILVAGGSVGASPLGTPVAYEYSIRTQGLLVNEEEFENIIIRKEPNGGYLRVKDVAKVMLGRESYATDALFNGEHVAALAIYQLPGSNAIDVLKRVESEMQKLEKYFPEGISYHIPLDTTEFIHASVAGIYNTLITAFILVLVVILLFLQDWRAMLIPLATIPVSLIGTFIFMQAMGFSLNTLTLFGLVLAIGLVVDDAIIVVENSYRLLETGKYNTVRAAVTQAMQEISGAIVGIVLVLTAIFVPTAFIGGITGELYRQFALTLAVATIISGFNALTLSPALCALLLKPKEKEKTTGFFGAINKSLNFLKRGYSSIARWFVHHSTVSFGVFILLLLVAFFSFSRLPRTFIPTEDQGYFIAFTQLTDGASQAQTAVVMDKISDILSKEKGIKNYITINGLSMMTGAESSNAGTIFAILTNWDERSVDSLSAEAIVKRFNAAAYEMIPEAETFAILPPAIPGLGESSGFEVMIQDINNYGPAELQKVADEIMYGAAETPGLTAVETMFSAETPEFYLNIDRDKVEMMQLSLNDVFTTLTTFLGSDYVNKFVKFGRTYEVNLEGSPESRSFISDLRKINVRNANGKMIPFTSFTTIENQTGANALTRYNTYLSALVQGSAADGYSSGEGIKIMEKLINKTVGTTFGYEWTSMAYQEVNASSSTAMIFVFAILAAFLILAAQYESWSSPAAVLMVIPIAILGVVAGSWISGLAVSVYTQIGMILLIGLAAKNAILIVSFARDFHAAGNATERAAIEGGDIRFRPILMTSLAVIFGTFPLVIATGAGASGRVSLGTALFSGMIMATIVGTLLVPAFYTIMQKVQDKFKKSKK